MDDLHEYRTLCCTNCGRHLRIPVYCGDRFCPVCSVGRRSRVRRRLEFLTGVTRLTNLERFKLLTLTVKNQTDLAPMLKHLTASFRRLRSHAIWKKNVRGGAFVIEVTGSTGNWHGHLHLILVSRWISWQQLRNIWLKVSGSPGVDIRNIPQDRAVGYLTKYITKPSCENYDLYIVNASLFKFRLFQPFGFWHSLNIEYIPPRAKCQICGNDHWLPLAYFLSGCAFVHPDVEYHHPPPPQPLPVDTTSLLFSLPQQKTRHPD
jgi:hypothetical protein